MKGVSMGDKNMGRDMANRIKWEKETLRRYAININKNTDNDIIEYLNTISNKSAYIVGLIRQDMKKKKK